MDLNISGKTRLICLFGDPVEHSRSPKLHNTGFERTGKDYCYMAFRVTGENIKEAMDAVRLLNMRGCNLTMPHKIAVIPYLDKIDLSAELIGAINTVVNEDGVLTGYNTDGMGFMKAFANHGTTVEGKKMTLIGMGGAGTAIGVQAAVDGLAELSIFTPRSGKSWDRVNGIVEKINASTNCKAQVFDSADEQAMKAEIQSSQLLANATSIGMGESAGQSPVPDPSFLHKDLVIQDAIYNPEETELLRWGKEIGCTTINGIEMLFYQGARAFQLWTGVEMPITPEEFQAM